MSFYSPDTKQSKGRMWSMRQTCYQLASYNECDDTKWNSCGLLISHANYKTVKSIIIANLWWVATMIRGASRTWWQNWVSIGTFPAPLQDWDTIFTREEQNRQSKNYHLFFKGRTAENNIKSIECPTFSLFPFFSAQIKLSSRPWSANFLHVKSTSLLFLTLQFPRITTILLIFLLFNNQSSIHHLSNNIPWHQNKIKYHPRITARGKRSPRTTNNKSYRRQRHFNFLTWRSRFYQHAWLQRKP